MAAIAGLIVCVFVPPTLAQDAGDDKTLQGVLQYAEDSHVDSESPEFVLQVGDTKQYKLIRLPESIIPMVRNSVGRNVVVTLHGRVRENKETGIPEIRIQAMSSVRSRRSATPVGKAKAKQRFEDSQKPLSEKEREAILEVLGEKQKLLDAESLESGCKLTEPIVISVYSADLVQWRIQPDGAFEKLRSIANMGDAETDPGMEWRSEAEGQLSERQLTGIAKMLHSSNLLELPRQIGQPVDTNKQRRRGQPAALSIQFGEFQSTGLRAGRASAEETETTMQQRRLTAIAYGSIRQMTMNLKCQTRELP